MRLKIIIKLLLRIIHRFQKLDNLVITPLPMNISALVSTNLIKFQCIRFIDRFM